MADYSTETELWFEEIREGLRDRIDTFEGLSVEDKKTYPTLRDWFVWPPEEQERWGHVGPIESEVDYVWDETEPKVRKELGGTKSAAANLVAVMLRDEFGIDIVDEVLRHGQPCYALHDQVAELDWDTEEETGYGTVAQLARHKDLDRGSALQLYWAFAPEYYTQFGSERDIDRPERKKAFKLLKQLETRLVADDFKTAIIPFTPMPERSTGEGAKWSIPPGLIEPHNPAG